MDNIGFLEVPELPELPLEPAAEYIRNTRLSLLEDSEKSSVDEIRKNHEYENKHVHGDQHDHDHERGVKHDRSSGHIQEQDLEVPAVTDPNAPKDKGYFVLITLCIFGLVHMIPFIFFFQANLYWMYKFRNTTNDTAERTYLQINFISLSKFVMYGPGIICTILAAIVGHKIKAQTRMFTVLFIHSSIVIFQAVFTQVNTDEWQTGFFVITSTLLVIMAASMALGGSGAMGLIAKLPPRYIKAELIGEGATSIFSAVLSVFSIYAAPSTVDAALIYFTTGAVLLTGTSIVFYFATKTKFFIYYTKDCKKETKHKIHNVGDFKAVLKIVWPILLVSVFPLLMPVSSVENNVVSEYKGQNSWGDKYFITVCNFMIPAVTGVIGRGIFSYVDFDCSLPLLYLIVISRESIFGIFTLLTNAQPRYHLPVLLKHDWQYALLTGGSALTTGFNANLLSLKTMSDLATPVFPTNFSADEWNMFLVLSAPPKDRIELSMMCSMAFSAIAMTATSPLGLLVVNLL